VRTFIEQKFWNHRSTSTQPPIILPLRLSHEGFKIFLKPRKVKVTFSTTKKSLSHEFTMEEGAWEEEDVRSQGQEGASEQQEQEGTMLEDE